MKKILFIINIVLMTLIIVGDVGYSLSGEFWIHAINEMAIVLIAAINLIYVLKTKSRPSRRFAYFIGIGILFAFAAGVYLNAVAVSGVALYMCSAIAYFIALIMLEGFKWQDLIYGVGIMIPMAITITASQVFGYGNIAIMCIAIAYVVAISLVLGKTIANLIKNKNSTNVLLVIASSFLTASSFLVLLNNFSHVASVFSYLYYAFNYIGQIIFAYSIFNSVITKQKEIQSSENAEEKPENKVKIPLKKSIKFALTMLSIALLAGYSVIFSFIHFNVASAKVTKDEFLAEMGDELEIPLIEINTENNMLPRNKEDYINCSFSITYPNDPATSFSIQMADNYGDEGSVGIRLRGNSTLLANKKPYRIKFEEKRSLCYLKKNKSWVLLADYYDQSYVRNLTAFSLADGFDGNNDYFSPTGHHVALIINGDFKGLYLLCEQMDENSGRADVKPDYDIDPTTQTEFPFFVEMDLKAHLEGKTGIDNFNVEGFYPVEIKYPEADERGKTETEDKVFDYIYEYINAAFKSLRTGEAVKVSFRDNPVTFYDLVDIDSAAHFYLVNETMLNADSIWKSIYFSKTADGKMKFGPIWDFDYSMTTDWEIPYKKSSIEEANTIYLAKYSAIFRILIQNPDFYNLVVTKFNTYKQTILETAEYLKDYKEAIDKVALIDSKMWHGTTGETQFDMQYDYVRLFLQDRYSYLNNVFNKPHAEFLSIVNS